MERIDIIGLLFISIIFLLMGNWILLHQMRSADLDKKDKVDKAVILTEEDIAFLWAAIPFALAQWSLWLAVEKIINFIF